MGGACKVRRDGRDEFIERVKLYVNQVRESPEAFDSYIPRHMEVKWLKELLDVITQLRTELAEREKVNKILEVKCRSSLANNLCSDHFDKQTFKPCLACTVETLEKQLAEAKSKIEVMSCDETEIEYLLRQLTHNINRANEAESELVEANVCIAKITEEITSLNTRNATLIAELATLRERCESGDELITDAWLQFSYEVGESKVSGGLSALDDIKMYLQERNIIDNKGLLIRQTVKREG